MSADTPTASMILFKSGTLAKRQMPRYKPNKINTMSWNGKTSKSVSSIVIKCCDGILKLKRNTYAAIQATTITPISCVMASKVR